jgi:hypothetical protein
MPKPFISKSQYIKGQQCLKALYLLKKHPELRDEISEAQKALFQSGTDVGIIAHRLFPEGVEISFDGQSFSEQIKRTKEEINKGTKTIYEATFSHDGLFIKADILNKVGKNWRLYEVKNSTGIKDVHLYDVAFQYYVLKSMGFPISKTHLVHIDSEYIREGDIEVRKLFSINDITNEVMEMQGAISKEIAIQRKMLNGKMPEIDIGLQCSSPYECAFQDYCWKHIPEESVFNLRGRGINQFDLYNQGIIPLQDVPKNILPVHGQIQLECALEKKDLINKESIKEFLNTLWYPLYFLDFETFMDAVPPYDGLRPYQNIPFQYSLYYKETQDSELGYHEFLAQPKADPRKDLLEKLIAEIPKNACIITYNQGFEKGILNSLKEWYPEYEEGLNIIVNNIRDLMIPFKSQYYYSWQMQGSYSMKAVLPALVPELNYDGLEINDGGMAMDAYGRMNASKDPDEIERIRKALLEYCRLDTLGMVRILEKLRDILQ